ncbi:MAG: hypothetical protein ACU0CO_10905 [Shimia sp.]
MLDDLRHRADTFVGAVATGIGSRSSALLGLAAGIFASLLLMALGVVFYTGQALGSDPRPVEQVYFP